MCKLVFFLLLFVNLGIARVISYKNLQILIKKQVFNQYQSMMYGIVMAESRGNSKAIGDNGKSVGLTQIHITTLKNMIKCKLLTKYQGKKLTYRRASKLRKDPKFNLYVANILAKHNENIIKNVAKVNKIKLTNTRLLDLVIKSHNQGVNNTIKRDLLKKKPVLKIVVKYLKKVRKYMKNWKK